MPELAEAEFYRKRWHQAALGSRIKAALVHPRAKVFRGTKASRLIGALKAARFLGSEAAAKQILFRFSGPAGRIWLGVHLGMSGELFATPSNHSPQKHDHLVLHLARTTLVFRDPRMFGRVQFHLGAKPPAWWARIAPPMLSPAFTFNTVAAFMCRRSRAPIKAVLLMQEQFPGVGNWMADEILWRAAIHPRRAAGSLRPPEVRTLWRECRRVARLALDTIAGRDDDLPPDLNVRIPHSWLFRHRWEDGGRCPKTGVRLVREEIGGRTSCWSPARQKLPKSKCLTADLTDAQGSGRTHRTAASAPQTLTPTPGRRRF
jgi:formamidopyrimidine-DNA glycosylase